MQYFCPVIDLGGELWTPTLCLGCEYGALTPLASQVNLAYNILYSGIFRVAWIGEESGIQAVRKDYLDVPEKIFERFMSAARNTLDAAYVNSSFRLTKNQNTDLLVWRKDKYLLNNTKKSYIPLSKYSDGNRVVDILPFLTVVTTPSLISLDTLLPYNGTWAFDTLSVSTTIPDGYLEYLVGEY